MPATSPAAITGNAPAPVAKSARRPNYRTSEAWVPNRFAVKVRAGGRCRSAQRTARLPSPPRSARNENGLYFIGVDGDVHELYIAPGAGWVDNNLTALA